MADTAFLAPLKKFADPDMTANGERRASVALAALRTLWINTGSLCNITCRNCYINSSPENDRLAYITRTEAAGYLDEIEQGQWPVREIGFTGGEPFINPDMIGMLGDALAARLLGFGADQRHAADAAAAHPRGPDATAPCPRPPSAASRQPGSLYARVARHRADRRILCQNARKASTGSREKTSRWRWPGAPAGARARGPRATAMPR